MKNTGQVEVYALMYNEALVLPYFLRHYREMFPNCHIVLFDNQSSDNSVEIALTWNNVEIRTYDTGGKLSDKTYLKIKNTCWRNAKTDWVLIADIDEHCVINADDLIREEILGNTLIRFEGFNMVGMDGSLDIDKIDRGIRAPSYDKTYCFRRSQIESINYGPGAHSASPIGEIKYSEEVYRCLHYKYIELEYMIKRHNHFASRLSDDNREKNYGGHYLYSRQRITKEFRTAQKNAIKIL